MESALVEHSSVSEAAVVSHPHPVKGECLYCFVTLRDGHKFTPALMDELRKQGNGGRAVGVFGVGYVVAGGPCRQRTGEGSAGHGEGSAGADVPAGV